MTAKIKLCDSEIKVMELIWENQPIRAKEVSLLAEERIGWNKNTTYTIIRKLEEKGYIHREEPGFICTATVTRDDACKSAARGLLDKLFGGSRKALFSALLEDEDLTEEELDELRKMLDKR